MPDPTFSDEELFANATALIAFEQQLMDDDPFDREAYETNEIEYLLDTWTAFPPEFRADMYSGWKVQVDEIGSEDLQDFEIVLMSFQTRDSKAEDAVKDGLTVFGLDWYQDNVMFNSMTTPRSLAEAASNLPVWSHQANLSPEEIERTTRLTAQGGMTYEPNPSQNTKDKVDKWFGRGTIALAAVLAAAAGVGAAAASPTVATALATAAPVAATAGRGVRSAGQWGVRQFSTLSQANMDVRIGTNMAVNRVPGMIQFRDFWSMVGARTNLGVSDLIVRTAERVPYAGPALGRVASAATSKRILMSLSMLGYGVKRSFFDTEEVEANKALLDTENEIKDAQQQAALETAEITGERPEALPEMSSFMLQGVGPLADALVAEIDAIDQAVNVAAVRTEEAALAEQVVNARQTQAARDEALRPGADVSEVGGVAPGGLIPPGESDAAVLADQLRDIQLGVLSFGDVTGVDSMDEGISEMAFAAIPGARWLEEGESEEELAAEGFIVHTDVSSLSSGDVRRIVLPVTPTGDPGAVIASYDSARAWVQNDFEEQQRLLPGVDPDPYIGVPEDYRAQLYSPINRRYAGGALDTASFTRPEGQDFRPVPGQPLTSESFSRPQQDIDFEESRSVGAQYRESDVYDQMAIMSPSQVFRFQGMMRDSGMYPNDQVPIPGQFTPSDMNLIKEVMWISNVNGRSFWYSADRMAKEGIKRSKAEKTVTTRSAAPRAPFSVPAHLRAIPGEKTVAEDVKARFTRKLGREATSEELQGIANELTGYHTTSNKEQIALYLAAYNGDNQGLLTGAEMQRIEDPGAATSFDIGEKWVNEIDLNKRRETNSESFSRILSATMGNRPSVGNLTPAGGVTQIGRNS